eukprot:m.396756 g.396756  ORF g.396756 m.396756 type:complete len:603 (+) comp20103_c0_seq29:222-2030(+)
MHLQQLSDFLGGTLLSPGAAAVVVGAANAANAANQAEAESDDVAPDAASVDDEPCTVAAPCSATTSIAATAATAIVLEDDAGSVHLNWAALRTMSYGVVGSTALVSSLASPSAQLLDTVPTAARRLVAWSNAVVMTIDSGDDGYDVCPRILSSVTIAIEQLAPVCNPACLNSLRRCCQAFQAARPDAACHRQRIELLACATELTATLERVIGNTVLYLAQHTQREASHNTPPQPGAKAVAADAAALEAHTHPRQSQRPGKTTCPALLKDLLVCQGAQTLLGTDCCACLVALIGHPTGLNLRNLLWHGFLMPEQVPPGPIFLLLAVVPALASAAAKLGLLNESERPIPRGVRCTANQASQLHAHLLRSMQKGQGGSKEQEGCRNKQWEGQTNTEQVSCHGQVGKGSGLAHHPKQPPKTAETESAGSARPCLNSLTDSRAVAAGISDQLVDVSSCSAVVLAPQRPVWARAAHAIACDDALTCLVLVIPQLESALRLVFAAVHDAPHRAQSVEVGDFYTTLDEILAPTVDGATPNRLYATLGPGFVDLLFDLFVHPRGVRLRDRLGHGELPNELAAAAGASVVLATALCSWDTQAFATTINPSFQ